MNKYSKLISELLQEKGLLYARAASALQELSDIVYIDHVYYHCPACNHPQPVREIMEEVADIPNVPKQTSGENK